jgi:hypothetical protein
LVFTRQDGELGQVLLASSEGVIERTLVSRKGLAEEPAWSPDGKTVAYSLEDDGGRVLHSLVLWYPNDRSDIWVVDNFDTDRE